MPEPRVSSEPLLSDAASRQPLTLTLPPSIGPMMREKHVEQCKAAAIELDGSAAAQQLMLMRPLSSSYMPSRIGSAASPTTYSSTSSPSSAIRGGVLSVKLPCPCVLGALDTALAGWCKGFGAAGCIPREDDWGSECTGVRWEGGSDREEAEEGPVVGISLGADCESEECIGVGRDDADKLVGKDGLEGAGAV